MESLLSYIGYGNCSLVSCLHQIDLISWYSCFLKDTFTLIVKHGVQGRELQKVCYFNISRGRKYLFWNIEKKHSCLFDTRFKISMLQCTPVAKKIQPFASIWHEIRVLWPNIKPVKSHTKALGFRLQTDMNQIFQMRYCTFL